MDLTLMWLVLAIILFVIEAATIGMVCLWFGIGAVFSMLSTFVTDNVYIQWLIFIVVSVAALVMLRPLAKQYIYATRESTNSEALIGREARLIDEITEDSPGRLKLGDISWIAIAENGEAISKGERVKVSAIKGNKLVVSKIKED